MLSRLTRRKPARARYVPPPLGLEPEVDVLDPTLEPASESGGDVPLPPPPRGARGSAAPLLRSTSSLNLAPPRPPAMSRTATGERGIGIDIASEMSSSRSQLHEPRPVEPVSHPSGPVAGVLPASYDYNGYQTSLYDDSYSYPSANALGNADPSPSVHAAASADPYAHAKLDLKDDDDIGWADYAEDFEDHASISQRDHFSEQLHHDDPYQEQEHPQNDDYGIHEQPQHSPYHEQDHYDEQSLAQAYKYPPANEYAQSNAYEQDQNAAAVDQQQIYHQEEAHIEQQPTYHQEEEHIEHQLSYHQEEEHIEQQPTYYQEEEHVEQQHTYHQEEEHVEQQPIYHQEEEHIEQQPTYHQEEEHVDQQHTYAQEEEHVEQQPIYHQEEEHVEQQPTYHQEEEHIEHQISYHQDEEHLEKTPVHEHNIAQSYLEEESIASPYYGHDQIRFGGGTPLSHVERLHLYSVVSSPFEGKHADDNIDPKEKDPISAQVAVPYHDRVEQNEPNAEHSPAYASHSNQSQPFSDQNWNQQQAADENQDFFANLTKETVIYNPRAQGNQDFSRINDPRSKKPQEEHFDDLFSGTADHQDDFFSLIGQAQYANGNDEQHPDQGDAQSECEHNENVPENKVDQVVSDVNEYNVHKEHEHNYIEHETEHPVYGYEESDKYGDHQSHSYYYEQQESTGLHEQHPMQIEVSSISPSSQVIEDDSPQLENNYYNQEHEMHNNIDTNEHGEATTNLDDLFADDNDFILEQSPKKRVSDSPVEPTPSSHFDISKFEMLELDDDLLLDEEPEFSSEELQESAQEPISVVTPEEHEVVPAPATIMTPESQQMHTLKPFDLSRHHGLSNRYVPQPGVPGQRSSFSVASLGPLFVKHATPTPKATIIQPQPQIRSSGLNSPAMSSNDDFVRKLEEEKKKHDAYDFPQGMMPVITKPAVRQSVNKYAPAHTPQMRSPSPAPITGPVPPHNVLIDTTLEEIKEPAKAGNPAKSFFEELPLPDLTKTVKPARSAAPVKVAAPISPNIAQVPSFAPTEQVKAPVNPYAVSVNKQAKTVKNNYAPPAKPSPMPTLKSTTQATATAPAPPPVASKYAPPAAPNFPVPIIQAPGQNLNSLGPIQTSGFPPAPQQQFQPQPQPQLQQQFTVPPQQQFVVPPQQQFQAPPQGGQFVPVPGNQFQGPIPTSNLQQAPPQASQYPQNLSVQGNFQNNASFSPQGLPTTMVNQPQGNSSLLFNVGSPASQFSQNSALSVGAHLQTTPKQLHSQPFPSIQGPTKPTLNTNVPKSISQGSPYMPNSGRYAPSSHRRNHSRASSIIGGSTKDGNNPYAPALPSVPDASVPTSPASLAPLHVNRQRGASGSRSHLRNVSGKPATQDPNALLRRQFPLFNWSGSTKVVCLIPKPSANFSSPPTVTLQVKNVRDIVDVSKYVNFPGPLTKGKTKKKDVEKWLESQIEKLKSDQSKQEELILCHVLDCLLKFDLSDIEQVKDFAKRICSVINPNVNYNSNVPIEYNGSLNVANASKLDNAGINTVFNLLQSGYPEKALEYAISKGDWSMGLVLAYMSGNEEFGRIAADYARVTFPFQRANNKVQHLMPYLLKIFAGNVSSAINDLITVPTEGEWACHYWRDFASAVLISCSKNSTEFFREFGKFLGSSGKVTAAEICFILGGTPLLPIPPVGSNSNEIVFPYISASNIYTEIYEYILASAPNSSVPPTGLPHLADIKVKYASYLVDLGLVNEGQKYIDYLGAIFKGNVNGKNSIIPEHTKIALQKLVVRLAASGSGEQGWFGLKVSKVNLDKVWGQLDKFIGGSDPVPKPAESAVFSKFSPSISRSTSVLDFTSVTQQPNQRPHMDHSLSSATLPATLPANLDAVSRHVTPIQRNTTFLSQGMSPQLHQGLNTPNIPQHPVHPQTHQSSPHSKYTPSNRSASHLPSTIDENEEATSQVIGNSRYAPTNRKSVGGISTQLSNTSLASHHTAPHAKHPQYSTHAKRISISSTTSDAGVLEFTKLHRAPPSVKSGSPLHPIMDSPKLQQHESYHNSPRFNIRDSEKTREMAEEDVTQSVPPPSSEGRFDYAPPHVPHMAGPGSVTLASSRQERRDSQYERHSSHAPSQDERRPSQTLSQTERRSSHAPSEVERRPSHTPSQTERRPSHTPSQIERRPSHTPFQTERRPSHASSHTESRPPQVERRPSHAPTQTESRPPQRETNNRYAPPPRNTAAIMRSPLRQEKELTKVESTDVIQPVEEAKVLEPLSSEAQEQSISKEKEVESKTENAEEPASVADSPKEDLTEEKKDLLADQGEQNKATSPVSLSKPPQRKPSNAPPRAANPYAPNQATKRPSVGRNKYGPPSATSRYQVSTPVKDTTVDSSIDQVNMFDYGGNTGSRKVAPPNDADKEEPQKPEQSVEVGVEQTEFTKNLLPAPEAPTDRLQRSYAPPRKMTHDELRSPPSAISSPANLGMLANAQALDSQLRNANPLVSSTTNFEPSSPMIRAKKAPILNQSGAPGLPRDTGFPGFDSKSEVLDTSFGEFPIPGSPELTTRANSEIGGPGLFSSRLSQSQQSELYQQYEVQDDTVGDYVPIIEEDEDDDEPVKRPAPKKLVTPPQQLKKMKTDTKDKEDDEKSTTSKGTIEGKWFGSWFGAKEDTEERPKAIRAKLGNKSQFYYSEEHKRWIDGSRSVEEQLKKDAPPPPPKAKGSISGPSSGPSAPSPASIPKAPVASSPSGQPQGGAKPPSKPTGPSLASADLDTLLTMGGNNPLAGARRPKKSTRRYVSVMEK